MENARGSSGYAIGWTVFMRGRGQEIFCTFLGTFLLASAPQPFTFLHYLLHTGCPQKKCHQSCV